MCHFDNKLRKISTTAIDEDYEKKMCRDHLPRSHRGSVNPGLHAKQVTKKDLARGTFTSITSSAHKSGFTCRTSSLPIVTVTVLTVPRTL